MNRLLWIILFIASYAMAQDTLELEPVRLGNGTNTVNGPLPVPNSGTFWYDSTTTTVKVGIILVKFTDKSPFTQTNRPNGFTLADFNLRLFDTTGAFFDTTRGDGTPDPDSNLCWGSMSDYWWHVTGHHIRVIGSVINPDAGGGLPQWLMADSSSTWYHDQASFGARLLWIESAYKACAAGWFDSTYQFFGIVTAKSVFPGFGIYDGGFVVSEKFTGASFLPPGSTTHESGHAIFDWLDEYAPFSTTSTGTYDLMATGGSRNGNGFCPAPPSPINRLERGWVMPTIITSGVYNLAITPNDSFPHYYVLMNPDESGDPFQHGGKGYYVLEEKLRSGFDRFVPVAPESLTTQPGRLLIWRTDRYDWTDLIEADTTGPDASNNMITPQTDFFPKNGIRQDFTPWTVPRAQYRVDQSTWLPAKFALYGIHWSNDTTYIDTVALVPSTNTVHAGGITDSTATINGSVNPNGLETIAWLMYGTTSGVYATRMAIDTLTGVNPQSISLNLTGLPPNSTYYFRDSSWNALGSSVGSELSFTTSTQALTPPTVTTDSASSITTTTASLYATILSDTAGTVTFKWGTDTTSWAHSQDVNVTGDSNLSITVSELSSGMLYYFRAFGTNRAGNDTGEVKSFTTLVAAPHVWTFPATNIGSSTAKLMGTIDCGGDSTDAWFFVTDSLGFPTSIRVLTKYRGGQINVSTTLNDLRASTHYYFWLKATNSAGTVNGSYLTFDTRPLPVAKYYIRTQQ